MSKYWYDLRKKIDKQTRKIQEKGNQRITFMLIPHRSSTMINIQLSRFSLFFALIVILMILISSMFSVKMQSNMQEEVDQLYTQKRSVYEEREQYMNRLASLSEKQRVIREQLYSLFQMSEMQEQGKSLFLYNDEIEDKANEQISTEAEYLVNYLHNPEEITRKDVIINIDPALTTEEIPADFNYSSEVIDYRAFHLELAQTIKAIKALANFLEERENVHGELPYAWPMAGGHFTSFYGPRISPFGFTRDFHYGIDLADEIGTPITAAADGLVTMAGYNGGYGNMVRIQHKYGYTTLYAHMSRYVVRNGQYVRKGQMIGRVGATGRVTGPHLHYEVKINGATVNPLPYLTSL